MHGMEKNEHFDMERDKIKHNSCDGESNVTNLIKVNKKHLYERKVKDVFR